MNTSPWVTMKDGLFDDCRIILVHQWTRVSPDGETSDEMGIVVIQPKNPIDSHPFTKTFKLSELNFVAFRHK